MKLLLNRRKRQKAISWKYYLNDNTLDLPQKSTFSHRIFSSRFFFALSCLLAFMDEGCICIGREGEGKAKGDMCVFRRKKKKKPNAGVILGGFHKNEGWSISQCLKQFFRRIQQASKLRGFLRSEIWIMFLKVSDIQMNFTKLVSDIWSSSESDFFSLPLWWLM